MKEKITRCSICKQEDCDGREYSAEYRGIYGGEMIERTVCVSQTHEVNGKRMYHVVVGHGCEFDVEVIPSNHFE